MSKSDFPNIYIGKNYWQVKISRKGSDGQIIKIAKSFAFDPTQPKTKKRSLDKACAYRDEQMVSILGDGKRSNVDLTFRHLLNEHLLSARLKEMKSEESVRGRIKFMLKMPEWKSVLDKPFRDLIAADFAKTLEGYREIGRAASTVNKFTSICSAVTKWAGHKVDRPEWAWVKERENLFEHLYYKVNDARERIPSDGEIELILESTESDNLRHALKFLHTLAMRRSELCALKWCDVYLQEKTPYFHIITSKNTEERFLPLNEALVKELNLIKASQTHEEAHVFVGKSRKALAPHALTRAFVRAVQRAEIENLRLHDFRRRGISDILKNNKAISLIHLQKISGHKNLSVLSTRYVKMDLEQLDEAMYYKEEPVFKQGKDEWNGKGRKPSWVQKLSEEELEKCRVIQGMGTTHEVNAQDFARFMAWNATLNKTDK